MDGGLLQTVHHGLDSIFRVRAGRRSSGVDHGSVKDTLTSQVSKFDFLRLGQCGPLNDDLQNMAMHWKAASGMAHKRVTLNQLMLFIADHESKSITAAIGLGAGRAGDARRGRGRSRASLYFGVEGSPSGENFGSDAPYNGQSRDDNESCDKGVFKNLATIFREDDLDYRSFQ